MATKAEVKKRVYKAYEDKGFASACDVFNAPGNFKHGKYQYCAGCETDVPSIDGECLICGQQTREVK